MVQIIKDMDELKTFLKAAGCKLVVVEFSAKWCGPCQKIYPLVHAMSLQYRNVMFAKVDVDDSQELAQTYHIKAVPTFQMFKQAHKEELYLDQFRYNLKTCGEDLQGWLPFDKEY